MKNYFGERMSRHTDNLPVLIVTGASGFIGRYFLDWVKEDYYIYAFARRSQQLARAPIHKNIQWIQLDIGIREMVESTMKNIASKGGADFIIHLAGYYDFSNDDSLEYERSNVGGTANMLEFAEELNIKRFIYASSLTVTDFDSPGTIVNEQSPADATFPYAVSKAKTEKLLQEYSHKFPCAIMRLAAIFSDWCEYGPLYMFLMTWLSKNWRSRILGGKGETAIPYLHVRNMNSFILKIIDKTENLPKCPVLIASPEGCDTHNQLYKISTKYVFRKAPKPFHMPKWVATIGVVALDLLGRIRGSRPFERLWMMHYLDRKLDVDPSETSKLLEWKPKARYHIKRRLLFMIENMKSNPYEWDYKNYEAIYKTQRSRPSLRIYEIMLKIEKEIIDKIRSELLSTENDEKLKNYVSLDNEKLYSRIEYIYQMIKAAVSTGDRLHIVHYGKDLALKRFLEGFEKEEVVHAVNLIGKIVVGTLSEQPELKGLESRIKTDICMTIQLGIDEIEDSFEHLTGFSDE